jgi:hypothetical protein
MLSSLLMFTHPLHALWSQDRTIITGTCCLPWCLTVLCGGLSAMHPFFADCTLSPADLTTPQQTWWRCNQKCSCTAKFWLQMALFQPWLSLTTCTKLCTIWGLSELLQLFSPRPEWKHFHWYLSWKPVIVFNTILYFIIWGLIHKINKRTHKSRTHTYNTKPNYLNKIFPKNL